MATRVSDNLPDLPLGNYPVQWVRWRPSADGRLEVVPRTNFVIENPAQLAGIIATCRHDVETPECYQRPLGYCPNCASVPMIPPVVGGRS